MLENVLSTRDTEIKKYGHCIYLREMNASDHTKTCTRIFTEALFVLIENWKQPKCPSTGDWTNNEILHSNKKKCNIDTKDECISK